MEDLLQHVLSHHSRAGIRGHDSGGSFEPAEVLVGVYRYLRVLFRTDTTRLVGVKVPKRASYGQLAAFGNCDPPGGWFTVG